MTATPDALASARQDGVPEGNVDSAKTDAIESSPAFQALSARLLATESSLATLTTHVAQLSALVRAALPAVASTSTFAPFDALSPGLSGSGAPGPTRDLSSSRPLTPLSTSDASVAALTQQIAALSTSVAQLQKLQSQSIQRQGSSSSSNPLPGLGGSGPSISPPIHERPGPGPLPYGLPRGQNGFGLGTNGPFTAGMPQRNSMISPSPHSVAQPHIPPHPSPGPGPGAIGRDFLPQSNRPGINRSISSSVVQDGERWPQPSHAGGRLGPNGLPMSLGPVSGRDWNSGPQGQMQLDRGMMTPAVSGPGAGAQGQGMAVTKWDHLGLKPELLRSVLKYGPVLFAGIETKLIIVRIGPPNKIQARVLPFMLRGSDVIAQAPPTQERIISYVIPALQLVLSIPPPVNGHKGPLAIIITTTVDQANQCHKLIRSIGGPLGVRAALATGVAGSAALSSEIAAIQRDAVQILVGTPAKLCEVMTTRAVNPLSGADVRLLVLDEVDQLIARNLYENVLSIARLLPPSRRGGAGPMTPGAHIGAFSPGANMGVTSPLADPAFNSPFNPNSSTPFPSQAAFNPAPGAGPISNGSAPSEGSFSNGGVERQTCLFSNTIPTDVINFSQTLQVRDPVRVLVRRDGGPNSQESVSSVTPGINVKHTYVYLTITAGARTEAAPPTTDGTQGPGAIGSGRTNSGGIVKSEEATRAKEYKLDTLGKLLDDYPLWQAVIHVGTFAMLEAVVVGSFAFLLCQSAERYPV